MSSQNRPRRTWDSILPGTVLTYRNSIGDWYLALMISSPFVTSDGDYNDIPTTAMLWPCWSGSTWVYHINLASPLSELDQEWWVILHEP